MKYIKVPTFDKSKWQIYRERSEYSILYVLRHWGEYDHRSVMEECYFYVGELKDHVLTKVSEFTPFKENYKVEDILALRAKHEQLSEQAREISSKLFPFGTTDY